MYKEQYYDKYQQKNENEQEAAEGRTTSTTTTVYTDPGVSRIDKQTIAEFYCKTIRQGMTMQVAAYLEQLLEEGMQPDVILSAIQETGWAPRPSPQYLRAILQRCRAQGVKTQQQWEYRQAERKAALDEANNARFSDWISYNGDGRNLPF